MRGRRGIKRKPQLTIADRNKFFGEIASLAGCSSDISISKRVYYAIIKVIMRHIREKGYVELPDWGMFYLIEVNGKVTLNRQTGQQMALPPLRMLKWRNNHNLKEYFNNADVKVLW
jgi:nucleoid DNA-binding protein